MPRKTRLILAGLLAFQSTSFADPIWGGEEIDAKSPIAQFTVLLYLHRPSDDKSSACTGSLIADDLVLTAGHCVPGNESPDVDFSKSYVFFGARPFTVQGRMDPWVIKRQVAKVVVHEGFEDNTSEKNGIKHDIALVRFKGGIPSGYSALSCIGGEAIGDTVRLLGYGEPDSKSPKRSTLRTTTSTLKPARECFTDDQTLCFSGENSGLTHGDSGGPVLIEKDGKYCQVGINSTVFETGTSGTAARVSAYSEWIVKAAQDIR